jgi:hypothetical protein
MVMAMGMVTIDHSGTTINVPIEYCICSRFVHISASCMKRQQNRNRTRTIGSVILTMGDVTIHHSGASAIHNLIPCIFSPS